MNEPLYRYTIRFRDLDVISKTRDGFYSLNCWGSRLPNIMAAPNNLAPLVCEQLKEANGKGYYARVFDDREPMPHVDWLVLDALDRQGQVSLAELEELIGRGTGKPNPVTPQSADAILHRIRRIIDLFGLNATISRKSDMVMVERVGDFA